MIKDFRGTIICVGDTIAYPGRASSSLWMNEGKVINIFDKHLRVERRDGRRLDITVTDRVVVIARALTTPDRDTLRLDFLQRATNKAYHSGKVLYRRSRSRNSGWLLYESNREGATADVRSALDAAMDME